MSSRALRKAQREREEHDRLQKLQQEEEEDDDASLQPAPKSAFAMLGEGNDDEEEESDGGAALDQNEATEPAESSIPPAPKSTKKKRKKKKAKNSGTQVQSSTPDEDLDEIDAALKQLSTNGNTAQTGTTSSGVNSNVNETSKLLAVDTSHLHAQNEMRRLFGRAALDQQDDDEPQHGNAAGGRRQQRRVQQAGLAQALRGQAGAAGRSGGLAAMALRRNIFIQGKEDWPIATGGGLGMEVEQKRVDGTVLYRFVHNSAYQDVQGQFEVCVESMDPNRLVLLLQHNPYHISTLLQVSEIAKQESDHATSGDLLERALFSFGRAIHSTFAKNLAEGKARLDFARPENREFWLASWRYMQNLSMRATWRTVYEWAKLLLSLSPEEDPYALWLVLDQYALRSTQNLDYLNISRNPIFRAIHDNMPNVQLSQSLAEYRSGNKGKGKQALFTAIGRFPWVVARLMQELAIDPPPSIWGKEPRTGKEKFYTELYATRAKDLWNTPETSALLTEVASALPPDTPCAEPDNADILPNEARHILLSDTPALTALLPRHFTARMTSVSDPLTPDHNLTSYITQHSSPARNRAPAPQFRAAEARELQGLHAWFRNIFPALHLDGPTPDGEDPGVEGNGSDALTHRAEEANRLMREAGVSEQELTERVHRMVELQTRAEGIEMNFQEEEQEEQEVDEGTQMQARVEDAADHEV